MRIQGIVTKATASKYVPRKNPPREGESDKLLISETVVVDDTLGQTITLNEWGDDPKFSADKSAQVDVAVSAIRLGTYGLQATLITDPE